MAADLIYRHMATAWASDPADTAERFAYRMKEAVELANGQTMTALELQRQYFERAWKHEEQTQGGEVDEMTREVLDIWGGVLDDLEQDPLRCADRLDWVAKLKLLQSYRDRDNLPWDSPKLSLIDLQYSDVRQAKGLYNRLVTRGSIKRLVSEAAVRAAVTEPPEDTRAYFRDRSLARYPTHVAAPSRASVIFDLGRESLVRIPTLEPLRGTRAHVGALLDASSTATELVAALTGG